MPDGWGLVEYRIRIQIPRLAGCCAVWFAAKLWYYSSSESSCRDEENSLRVQRRASSPTILSGRVSVYSLSEYRVHEGVIAMPPL